MPIVNIDTKNGTEFYQNWYQPYTSWPVPNNLMTRLPQRYSFDLEKLRDQVRNIKETYGFQPFPVKKGSTKKRMTYKGIGITARAGAEDPLYDALHLYSKDGELDISDSFDRQANALDAKERETVPLYEKHFSEPTGIYTGYIAEILSKFQSPLTKTRLLELCPRGVITPHVDFPYYEQIRVHAAVETNEDVWWEVEGQRFQLPADGNFYWFDTGRYHAVWNDGRTDRIVLSVNLSVFVDREGSPINRDMTIDEMLGSDRL